MRYLSVCSGIEAASVAWESLGWTPIAFAEIERFPSQVLAHHFPGVPNLGDMTRYKDWDIDRDTVDLIVGGTPCQSFSVAGLRKGLEDPRGNLALTFLGMVDHYRPEWVVWENVPGVLSSSGGRDFGSFLGALGQLGYGFAYRVLDAQYFGVAQRRKRVFIVASARTGGVDPVEILLVEQGVCWDPPSRGEAGAAAPAAARGGAPGGGAELAGGERGGRGGRGGHSAREPLATRSFSVQHTHTHTHSHTLTHIAQLAADATACLSLALARARALPLSISTLYINLFI